MCVMENAKWNALSSFWLSVFATCTLNYLLWIFGWFEYSAGVNSFFMVRKKKNSLFFGFIHCVFDSSWLFISMSWDFFQANLFTWKQDNSNSKPHRCNRFVLHQISLQHIGKYLVWVSGNLCFVSIFQRLTRLLRAILHQLPIAGDTVLNSEFKKANKWVL